MSDQPTAPDSDGVPIEDDEEDSAVHEIAAMESAFLEAPVARGWFPAESGRQLHQDAKIFRATTTREFRFRDKRDAALEKRVTLVEKQLEQGAKSFAALREEDAKLGKIVAPLRPSITSVFAILGTVLVVVVGGLWALFTRFPDASALERHQEATKATLASHEARLNAQAVDAAQQRALLERVLLQMDGIDAKIDRLR